MSHWTTGDLVSAADLNSLFGLEEQDWAATDRSTSASEGSMQAHSGTKTVTDPGYAVKVFAMQTVTVAKGPAVGEVEVAWKIEVSIDGGSTWTSGQSVTTSVPGSVDNAGGACAYGFVSGTPSGDIVVRLLSQRNDAESGSVNANAQGGFVRVVPT